MQLLHKTPLLWTRAGVPWTFGHDTNKFTTSIEDKCRALLVRTAMHFRQPSIEPHDEHRHYFPNTPHLTSTTSTNDN